MLSSESTTEQAQRAAIVQSIPFSLEGNGSRRHILPDDEREESEKEERWSGSFYFIQAADTQFGMIDSYLRKLEHPRWEEEMRLSELLVEKCNKLEPKPLFMVICGDLVDALPLPDTSEMRREQIFDFKRIFSKLDPTIPLVCVCGNHDIGNEPTLETLLAYKSEFGDDYFYFVKRGVLFIVINSQFYRHRANLEYYAARQDTWLEAILAKCKQFKYSVVFQHIPWWCIEFRLRSKWLAKFKEAGVSLIMCGHLHKNGGNHFGNMETVMTSAVGDQFGDDKSGFRVVRLCEESIEHQYYDLE